MITYDNLSLISGVPNGDSPSAFLQVKLLWHRKISRARLQSPDTSGHTTAMVTLPEQNALPWKSIEDKKEKWAPEQQGPFTQNLHFPHLQSSPKASRASPRLQHVAEGRQFTDNSILPSLLLGVASLLLLAVLPQLAPEHAAWVVGPRPPTGLLQPAVLLLERVLGVERPRLESDEMCGVTTGGQVKLGWPLDSEGL